MKPLRIFLSFVAFLLVFGGTAHAHRLGESYLYLQVYEDSVSGRFEIALTDLNPSLELSGTEREITAENLEENYEFIRNYYLQKVSVANENGPLTIEWTESEILNVYEGYVLLSFDLGGLDGLPEKLIFDYAVLFDENHNHRAFLLVEYNWATGTFANENRITALFTPEERRVEYSPSSPNRLQGFSAVIRLGIDHIWKGVDHIIFLLALLLPAVLRREDGKWQPVEDFMPAFIHVVKIVTAFTVAHSITLSLAALGIIELPSWLVETIIAASIAVAAADLLYPIFRGRIWMIVFGFGLFHGFGFAGALGDMGVLGEHRLLSLFGFNLGVEIGQVVIVLIVFPVLFALRKWSLYRKLLPVAAVGMIVLSGLWIVERAFGVDIPIRETLPPALQKIIP